MKMKRSDIIFAIVLVFCVFIFIYSRIGSNNVLVVLSESMKPTINMGDLVVTAPIDSNGIRVGDIVAFEDGDKKPPVTHRVINITESGFVTKGDANEDPDAQTRSKNSVIGKIVFWIPFAGYLVYFARSFYGFIILIVIPGILLIIIEARNILRYVKEDKVKKKKTKKLRSSITILLLSVLLISITSIASSNGYLTGAYFSDIEKGLGFLSAWIEEITVNKWWSDTEFVPMSDPMYNNNFDVVIHGSTKKVSSTNPGGFFINIKINNIPSTDSIIITDTISTSIRPSGDFVLQSGKPFHAYLNGLEVKDKFEYTFDGTTFTATLKGGEQLDAGELYVNLHIKYAFVRTTMTGDEIAQFPYTYTNLATVTINDNTIQSSAATLTANLKWIDKPKEEINNETNSTNSTNSTGTLSGGGGSSGGTEPQDNITDVTPPQYSNESINGTQADSWVSHDVFWTDIELSGYIFSFDNCLGEFVNDTWTQFNESWSNVTKLINSTIGCIVRWKVYANDSSNNWNETEEFNYTITAPPDVTPPTWSYNSTNSTLAGTAVEHSVLWNDDVQLSGYIFSFDNCEGLLTNDTWVPFVDYWLNVTKLINSTVNCTINWMIYANDTSNNWNVTDLFTYITTENITENTTSEIITYYNYSDTTNNKIYYSYNESLEEYPIASLDPNYGQEANSSEYLATLNYEGVCDSNNCFEYTFTNNETNKTVWHSFVFKINENMSDIKSINISWVGYAENLIDGKFRILTNDSYEDISDITNENQIYNYNITSNFENYLNSGYLRFQVWALTDSLSDSIKLWTDFVGIAITTLGE
jgi:signal peptidase